MTFDNSDFEGKISKTLQSLEKLNETLSKTSAADGLKEVSKALKEVQAQVSGMNFETEDIIDIDESETKLQKFGNFLLNIRDKAAEKFAGMMDGAEEGIDGANDSMEELGNTTNSVGHKFSALNSLVQGVFLNLGSRVADFGTKMLKSITLEPLTTGFNEYELKTNSISTILANTADKGETLDTVTAALDELNKYSDQTIYNFAQMTDNIGKFTAAGVGLEDSVAAIKGMSNLAAFFGVDATKAAGAMYQMSQALAAGKVQLMDWNSLQNAGMSGEAFQKALIRTSEVMGTGAEAAIEKFGSFRESLTKGEWLTSDVMIETLKQISGAYKESELRAQGFTATQAKAISDMAKRANKAATEVRTITGMMDAMKESVQSGWAISWEHIIGDKDQATELLTNIKNGFDSIIGPSTEARNKMLQFWNESGGRDAAIRGFSNIIQSVGKGLGSIGDAWKEVFPSMTGQKLTDLSTKFRDLTYKFKMNDETAKKIKNTFKGVFDVFKTVGSAVGNVVKGLKPLLGVFPSIGSAVLSVTSTIGKFASTVSKALSEQVFDRIGTGLNKAFTFIGDKFEALKTGVGDFFNAIGSMDFSKIFGNVKSMMAPFGTVLTSLGEGLGKAVGSIDFNTIMKGLQTASGLKLAGHIKDTFKSIGGISEDISKVTKSFGDIFKNIGNVGKEVVEVLGTAKEALEAWQRDLQAGTLLKIAGAVAVLAASLLLLSTLDVKELGTGLLGVVGIITALLGAYVGILKAGGAKGLMGINSYLITMAASLMLLSVAMKILSSIEIGEMLTGLVGLAGLLMALNFSIKAFDGKHKGLKQTAAALLILSVALMGMAGALKLLGSIDAETLGGGLFAMAAVLLELAGFLALAKFGNLSTSTAAAVLILAAALVILSQAVKMFGNLETGTIIRGLAGIAGIMTEIALFSKFGSGGLKMTTMAVGLAAMGAAILVLSQSMKSMGSISWETIGRGLTALAGALTVLGVASKLISGPQMLLLSVGLGAMSIALMGLSIALSMLGGQSWEEIGKSLVALAGSLAILAVAMYAMSGCLLGAAAMLVMAAALAIFTPQLLALSQLSLAQVGIGLLALAGALAVIGVAGYALAPVVPAILGLAAAVALLGVGCAAAGAGMALFGTGFGVFAAAVAASGFAIIEFIRQLIGLLPQIGLKAGEAMVNFAGAVGQGAPQIISAFSTLLQAILTAIQTNIPLIAQTGMDIVLAFAKTLAEGIPQLVTYGMEMVTGVLEGIAANIGQLVDAGVDVCVNFIDGVANNLGRIIDSGINLALSFIEGVADGISNNKDRLEAAIEKVIQAMVDAGLAILQGGIDGFVSGGEDLANGLIDGIVSLVTGVSEAAGRLVDAAVKGVGDCGKALYSAGQNLVKGFTNGISSALSWVGEKAREIASKAKSAAEAALGIKSPSRVFMKIGRYVDEGFVKGLEQYSANVDKTAFNVANGVVDNFAKPLSNMNDLLDMNTNPVITPVLDLSNVQANSRRLNSMIPGNGNIALSTDAANIMTSSMGTVQNGVSNSEVVSAIKDLKNSMPVAGNTNYNINGITYDDGSNIVNAVETLVRAARIERRI
jgi:tape measure domain-containing protein